MKLIIETTSANTAQITLDGKSVTVVSESFGYGSGQADLNELPDDSIGKELIQAIWQTGLKLLFAESMTNGNNIWEKSDEETLEEIYYEFS